MADHLIKLPEHFQSVQSREPGCSNFRNIAASLANIVQIATPGKYANAQTQVSRIYEDYTQQPDISANAVGLTKDQALAYLTSQGIEYIDETSRFNDVNALKHEMQAQNLRGVFQLLVLADETKLRHAVSGLPLHNWIAASPVSSCSLLRVGYSDSTTNAYYIDAELSPAFEQPIPIDWGCIEAAGLLACIAILPGVRQTPPVDFSYFAGTAVDGTMLPPNEWPIPEPPKLEVNVDELVSTLSETNQALESAAQAISAATVAHQQIMVKLGKG